MFSSLRKILFGSSEMRNNPEQPENHQHHASVHPALDYHVTFVMQTDPGCIRENNEDNGVVLPSLPDTEETFLAVIADGMGGHAAGEVASRIAVEVIPAEYQASRSDRPGYALREALVLANSEIFEQAQTNPEYRRMGTTCIAVAIQNGQLFYAHVGDSRLYQLRQNILTQLTEDHSYVMQLVKEGQITREEAAHHENKNIILRAMGTKEQVEVDFTEKGLPIIPGDKYLLCTDGLHDVVSDTEITALLKTENLENAATQMIELAKKNGGPDNITVIIMDIRSNEMKTNIPATKITRYDR